MYRYESLLVQRHKDIFPLSELASRSGREFGDLPVMRTWNGNGYDEISYSEFADRVESTAHWLVQRGIKRGDRVAVLAENRPEWGMAYLAAQAAGAIVVPVDSMMPEANIRHIIDDSRARILFTSSKFLGMVAEWASIESLETVVCFDDTNPLESTVSFAEVSLGEGTGSGELPHREMDEDAAIIYTSGTTGHSKGVVLTQRNIMSNVGAAYRILDLDSSDTYLSVLPMHHTYECTNGFLLPLFCGCSITYARSMKSNELLDDMRRTNVTIMVAVPLLYEKVYQGFQRKLRERGAVAVGLVKLLMGIDALGGKFGLRPGRKLFRSMREKAGMGSIIYFVSGGGPLDPKVATFFHRFGLHMLQGYGLTETSPLTHVNLPKRPRHECVGPPILGVEQKILDPDAEGIGEILVKGPNVFRGYYNNEEATKAAFDEEGWFRTGDLGKIHPDDYLQVTGRAKNMLVTAGGKNVYPEEIEHLLNRSDFIAESLVLGIERDGGYGEEVAALIYPDYEQIDLHFQQQAKKPSDDDVHALIRQEVRQVGTQLEDYKRIRRFRLLEEEFQKTSTRKIKRYLYKGDMIAMNGERV